MQPLMGKYFGKPDEGSENIIHEVELKLDKKRNMYYRPGTSDRKMLIESSKDYPMVDCSGKVVLDLGANIGGFTKIALDQGVKHIVAFEPDDFNFEVLEANINDDRAELVKAAVIDSDEDYVEFHMSTSGNSACSGSIIKLRRTADIQRVNAVNFRNMLEKYKPSLVKMDVEGAEFDLLKEDLPDYVQELAVEFHGFRKETNKLMYEYFDRFAETWDVLYKDVQIVFNAPCIICAHFVRK